MTGTLHEDLFTFFITSRSFILRMRNVSEQGCRENQNTHFMFNIFFFFENRVVYEIMWENIIDPGRQRIIRRMCIAHWIPKATNTHSRSMYYLLLLHFNNGCMNASQC